MSFPKTYGAIGRTKDFYMSQEKQWYIIIPLLFFLGLIIEK
jgi:hypothetical protein